VFRVVSLPPMISKVTLEKVLIHRGVAGVGAVRKHRDEVAARLGVDAASFHSRTKYAPTVREQRATLFIGVQGPWPGAVVMVSDQTVSLRRSSNGKSKQRRQGHRGQLFGDQVDPV